MSRIVEPRASTVKEKLPALLRMLTMLRAGSRMKEVVAPAVVCLRQNADTRRFNCACD
ncbi:hypothetical protein [Salinibacterium sp. ZJ454]|uniref:hypothetical protein n=1 Tax=Salinibacterium sp. ZJ454 TaxID=2708339 RepID=UPI0014212441|nr:hypothetical protein [Salinibacterium sp. ZJ454]